MARFKVGDWVRLAVGDKMASWPAGKVLAVREDYQLPTIYAVEHEPGRPDRIVNWPEHRLEPAPPPVGERVGHIEMTTCPCVGDPDFDPANWCPCTPEPATTDRRVYFAADGIRPNATDELAVYCPHYSVRGRACLECRNRAARARKARGGGA